MPQLFQARRYIQDERIGAEVDISSQLTGYGFIAPDQVRTKSFIVQERAEPVGAACISVARSHFRQFAMPYGVRGFHCEMVRYPAFSVIRESLTSYRPCVV